MVSSPRAEEQLGAKPEAGPRETVVEGDAKPRCFRGRETVSFPIFRSSFDGRGRTAAKRRTGRGTSFRPCVWSACERPRGIGSAALAPKYPELEYFSPRTAPNGRISAVSTHISRARDMLPKPLSRRRTASEFGSRSPPGRCSSVWSTPPPGCASSIAWRLSDRNRGASSRIGDDPPQHAPHLRARGRERARPPSVFAPWSPVVGLTRSRGPLSRVRTAP